ncbi:MAG: DUF4340 domain-containing protein [bacterium]|nr:DUF4340 domain-containing protein [bacterium]
MSHLPKSVIPLLLLIVVAVAWLVIDRDPPEQNKFLLDMTAESIANVEISFNDIVVEITKTDSGYLLSGTVNDNADQAATSNFLNRLCNLKVEEIPVIADAATIDLGQLTITAFDGEKTVTCRLGKMNPVSGDYYVACSNRPEIVTIDPVVVSLMSSIPFSLRQRLLFGEDAEFAEKIKVRFPGSENYDEFVKDGGSWWLVNYSGDDSRLGKVVSVRRDLYNDRTRDGAYQADENLISNLLFIAHSAKVTHSSTVEIEPPAAAAISIGSANVEFSFPEKEQIECWRNSNPYPMQVNKKLYEYAFGNLQTWLMTKVTDIKVSRSDSLRVSMLGLAPITAKKESGKWVVEGHNLSDQFSDLSLELERMEIVSVLETEEYPLSERSRANIEIWIDGNSEPVVMEFGRSSDSSKLLCLMDPVTVEVAPQMISALRTLYMAAGLWN